MKMSSRSTLLATLFLCLAAAGASAAADPSGTPTPSPTQATPSFTSPSTWAPPLQAAIFTTTAGAVLSLIGFLWGHRQKGKAEEAQQAPVKAQMFIAPRIEDRIGYKIGGISLSAEIAADGSFKGNWRWEDVQRVREDVPLTFLPGEVWYSPPDCRITKIPTLKDQPYKRALDIRVIDLTDNRCKFQVEIEGGLGFGDKLTYEYEAEVYKGFFMTRDDVEKYGPRGFKKEYWAFTVVTPVDSIEVYVKFPDGYTVDAFAGVYAGDTPADTSFHSGELDRIDKSQGFVRGSSSARLRVDAPIMGFTYLIYWLPPGRKSVDGPAPAPVK